MAIVIKQAEEPVNIEQIMLLIYGQPGIGKTTLGCTAEGVLVIDFDQGIHRALLRAPRVEAKRWQDVAGITARDVEDYSTIVVDTFGKAQQALSNMLAEDRSLTRRNGEMTQQGWGALRRQFIKWIADLKSTGKDVVILAHSEERPSGDSVVERPLAQGGARNEIYQMMDAIGLLSTAAGEIRLDFDPAEGNLGKNGGTMPTLVVPNPAENPRFLSEVLRQMKQNINSRSTISPPSDRARAVQDRLASYTTAEQFTTEMAEMRANNASTPERRMLVNAADAKGFVLDRQQGVFVANETNVPTPPPATPAPNAPPYTTPAPEPVPAPSADRVEPEPELSPPPGIVNASPADPFADDGDEEAFF